MIKKNMATLPGDPREDEGIKDAEDLISLKSNVMLWTKLLDYVLYFVCSQSSMIDNINHALASTLTQGMIGQSLDPHISERIFNLFKSSFKNFRVGKC